jgi:hypothetical protein
MATAVHTSRSTVTVNAAFLQEIKEVNQELWRLLENLRQVCSSAVMVQENAAELIDMLHDLRDQLALHFALEEAYGYFEDPALVVPTVAHQAATLRAEHRHLYAKAIRLSHEAENMWFDGNLADLVVRTPDQFWEFDTCLQQHESHENELIMRQFDDIGVGD